MKASKSIGKLYNLLFVFFPKRKFTPWLLFLLQVTDMWSSLLFLFLFGATVCHTWPVPVDYFCEDYQQNDTDCLRAGCVCAFCTKQYDGMYCLPHYLLSDTDFRKHNCSTRFYNDSCSDARHVPSVIQWGFIILGVIAGLVILSPAIYCLLYCLYHSCSISLNAFRDLLDLLCSCCCVRRGYTNIQSKEDSIHTI